MILALLSKKKNQVNGLDHIAQLPNLNRSHGLCAVLLDGDLISHWQKCCHLNGIYPNPKTIEKKQPIQQHHHHTHTYSTDFMGLAILARKRNCVKLEVISVVAHSTKEGLPRNHRSDSFLLQALVPAT
jgi:hypothetical protein